MSCFRGLRVGSQGQTYDDELLQRISIFGGSIQEGPTKAVRGLCFHRTVAIKMAEIRRLRDYLDSAENAHHQLRHHLCIAQDTLASKEEKSRALATDYYCLNNGSRSCDSNTNDEREPKPGRAFEF